MHAETQELFQYTTRLNPKSHRFTLQTGNEKDKTLFTLSLHENMQPSH